MAVNLINLEDVTVAHGTKLLLDKVSLGVSDNDRIGVVGRNGGGKTTLLKTIVKTEEPHSGRVTHSGGLRIGILTQDVRVDVKLTAHQAILGDTAEHTWAGDAKVRAVLDGLGLHEVGLDAVVETMSGGERRRVALAALLIGEWDLIVLDEPTNHLDVEGVAWLAAFLKNRRGAHLVVTHDRWFLDEVNETTWEVHDGTVDSYDGGYSAYVLARAERDRMASTAESKRVQLAKKELAWLRRGPPARTSKPKFRIDAANALIADEPPARDEIALQRFATARLGKQVYDVEDVSLSFGERVLFDHVTWRVGPGDRIGIVGVNGAGKSTLLKMLAGVLPFDRGERTFGANVAVHYYAQHQLDALDPARTVLEELEQADPAAPVQRLRSILGSFLFSGDQVDKRISVLSGGEKARVALAKMLVRPAALLCMDEPTNHLDLASKEVLEEALAAFTGTIVFISHDRYFINRIATHVVEVDRGRLTTHLGNYDDYLARKTQAEAGPAGTPRAAAGAEAPRPASRPSQKTVQPPRKALDREIKAIKARLLAVETQISTMERRLEEISLALADPDLYRDGERARQIARARKDAEGQVAWLMKAWEELSQQLAAATDGA